MSIGIPELLIILIVFGAIAFGLIILVLVVVKASSRNATKLPSGKKCPFCAETIQPEAIVCRFCSRDLEMPAKA